MGLADDLFLAARQHSGPHLGNAHPAGNGQGHLLVVAGEHDRRNPHGPQFGHRRRGSGLFLVSHGENADHNAIHLHQHDGFALAGQSADPGAHL